MAPDAVAKRATHPKGKGQGTYNQRGKKPKGDTMKGAKHGKNGKGAHYLEEGETYPAE